MKRIRAEFAWLAALLLLAGCATAPYIPDAATRQSMNPVQAAAVFESFSGACWNGQCWQACADLPKISISRMNLICNGGIYPWRDVQIGTSDTKLLINDVCIWGIRLNGVQDDRANAQQLALAILTLKDYFTTDRTAAIDEELRQFEPIAQDYRARNPKPALPEEARRFQIQAEHAFDRKAYIEAANLYRKALAIAPWWPEGHYNTATLLGQTALRPDAVLEMKKYLALAPDSPDARKAQDKIYTWEGQGK